MHTYRERMKSYRQRRIESHYIRMNLTNRPNYPCTPALVHAYIYIYTYAQTVAPHEISRIIKVQQSDERRNHLGHLVNLNIRGPDGKPPRNTPTAMNK